MTILDDIASYKRDEVARAKVQLPLAALSKLASAMDPPRGFRAALESARAQKRYGLIAEIKKASPSKGLIRADFNPSKLAMAYEQGGATCLSVLTDTPSFQGAPLHLSQVHETTKLPVLRKDFMLEPYQVVEARAWGADCVLVILAMLNDAEARVLCSVARDWSMDALIEVHDERELDRSLALGAEMIGINNRDLKTFATNLEVSLRLVSQIPKTALVVAESGLSKPDDLKRMADAGITTFLIGESLMRETDVALATAKLLGAKIPQ